MQNNILVSVVVPVYNVEKYLSRCIDSISRQSYSNLQIILVDDGSKDNSSVICDEYSKKDTRISVIHKTNGGLSDARNVGIDNAKGDYICFIDSDDFVRETYVEDLLNAILKYNSDIAVCLFEKGNSDKFNDVVENNQQNEIVLNNIGALNKLYDEVLNVNMVVAWNKLYSKNLFYKIRFPVGKIHEDEFTTPKLLFEADKIVVINKKDYYYFQSPNSIMRSEFKINRLDALEAFEERINLFNQTFEYIDMPILAFVMKKGEIYFIIYNIILYLGIFTSLIFTLLTTQNYLKDKKSITKFLVLSIITLIGIMPFGTIVEKAYPIMGVVGTVFILFFTYHIIVDKKVEVNLTKLNINKK